MDENWNPSHGLQQTKLPAEFKLVARGKVRDVYEINDKTILFIATDRISAYDVIMKNPIPYKGIILTAITQIWFDVLSKTIPDLRTHFITSDLPGVLRDEGYAYLRGRSMQVKKLKVFPIEAIVRGYITGSAWKEYKSKGTMHGIPLQSGLKESQKIPGGPFFTPSTKAEAGEHDENIHPSEVSKLVGPKYAKKIEELSLKLYVKATEYAAAKGFIIADTKFEFGLDESTDEVVLVDEVLTPDSSRFWSLEEYEVGRPQKSFDKQGLRDWLTKSNLNGKADVEMPLEVVNETKQRYLTAYKQLTGMEWKGSV